MSTSEIPLYPRGQISFGAGDLVQVTNVTFAYTHGTKLKHTLKRSPSGKVLGNQELSGKFDCEIDQDGPERDYFARVASGEEVNMRLKLPNLTKNIVGVLVSIDGDMPLDDAVKLTINWVGKFTS